MTNTITDIRPGTYTIDPARSAVRFTATHVLGLKPVHGTMTVRSGTVMVAEEPRRSTVSAEIDAASWTSDDDRRNRDVRGRKFLDAERHPVIGFRSTRLTGGADGWEIAGVLSVRGGSCEVTLLLGDAGATADGYRFVATTRVDRIAAGVTGGRAVIGRHLDVALTVVVVR
jgi:polyisoprenoid-binding protein YceI